MEVKPKKECKKKVRKHKKDYKKQVQDEHARENNMQLDLLLT